MAMAACDSSHIISSSPFSHMLTARIVSSEENEGEKAATTSRTTEIPPMLMRPSAAGARGYYIAQQPLPKSRKIYDSGSVDADGRVVVPAFGAIAEQHRRPSMEDAMCAQMCDVRPHDHDHGPAQGVHGDQSDTDKATVFAVFDGHGGHEVSQFCAARLGRRLTELLSSSPNSFDGEEVLSLLVHALDRDLRAELPDASVWSGSTALIALYHNGRLFVAHCGDSRAVLCTVGGSCGDSSPPGGSGKESSRVVYVARALTVDHKPDRPDERARIEAAGGLVSAPRGRYYLVDCSLAMSRALGDTDLNCKGVTPEPELTTVLCSASTPFVILATDGVWDVLDNQAAVDIVAHALDTSSGAASARCFHAAGRLTQEAVRRGSSDNITSMVVALAPLAQQPLQ